MVDKDTDVNSTGIKLSHISFNWCRAAPPAACSHDSSNTKSFTRKSLYEVLVDYTELNISMRYRCLYSTLFVTTL